MRRTASNTPAGLGLRGCLAEKFRITGRGSEAHWIRRFLESGPTARLLDVGGGTGAFTSQFGAGDKEVVVLEPGSKDVRAGQGRHTTFHFVQGVGEKIPFRAGAFELVTAIRSTHHMHAPERFFQEALRVLSDRGRILIEERAKAPLLAGLMRFAPRCRSHHLDTRRSAEWVRVLHEAGFEGALVTPVGRWFFVSGAKRTRGNGPTVPHQVPS